MVESASEEWTILRVLDWTRQWFAKRGIETARLDAELLIAHALDLQRVMLYARFDQPLAAPELAKIRGLVKRRGAGEPVAYLTGTREFWSLEMAVAPAVLIPRPDTEVLVEEALTRASETEVRRIADVGTGTGCIAIALAKELPVAEIWALERAPDALAVATKNIETHGLTERVHPVQSNLLAGLPASAEPLDLLVANLPYVDAEAMSRLDATVRDFEPHVALHGGADGLDLIRALVDVAPQKLRPGGIIALEAGYDQLEQVADILTKARFEDVRVRKDYGDNPRVATATLAG